MKYLIKVSYDGSKFYGYASQPNLRTIQGEIEKILKKIFDKKIIIHASGRTDRYVHAIELPITFDADTEYSIKDIKKKLKQEFPADINLLSISIVDKKFSARFSAKKKTYIYKIDLSGKKNRDYYHYYFYPIDKKKILDSKEFFIGEKNFASFTGKQKYENYVRNIHSIKFKQKRKTIEFEVTGDGFMRYMVRNIIGIILTYNREKIDYDEFIDLFNNPERGKAHYKAPGCGLYLKKVFY